MKNFDHVLKKSDSVKMQRHFVFFDTETIESLKGEYRELSMKMGWAVYWDRETDARIERFFENPLEFWAWIESMELKDLTLFAHNAGFDMKVTKGYQCLITHYGYRVKSFYIKDKIYKLELIKEKRMLRIYDTFNFVGMSLADLGKAMGHAKGKVDFQNCSHEELKAYCLNDVLIIEKFIRALVNFLNEHDLGKLTSTGASLAFSSFRHRFYDPLKIPICIHAHPNTVKLERESYRGGITDCFRIGRITGPQIKVDINSMYPDVMKRHDMPTRRVCYLTEEDPRINRLFWKNLYGYLTDSRHWLGIADVTISLPEKYAYILVRMKKGKQKKCGFVKGTFRATLTWPEIAYVKRHGIIRKVHRLALYEHHNIFSGYVDFFYGKRTEYRGNNPAFDLMCKLFLNKLYGKFGQRKCSYDRITDQYEAENIREMSKGEFTQVVVLEPQGNRRYLRLSEEVLEIRDTEENSFNSFVAIASYVTAYARMNLIGMIEKAGRINVYYCDTDSMIMSKESEASISGMLDDREIGKLKLEGEAQESVIYKPKFYSFGGEFKCKGMRKDAQIVYEDDKKLIVRQDQFEGFSSSLKENSLDMQRIKTIEKEISKVYDKGIIGEDGSVYPFDSTEVRVI